MRLKDTGLTVADVKAMAQKYQIETYERMDFLADWAKGVYMYDENDQPYLDFYAGIAVNSLGNCNPKVVAAVQEQCATLMQTFNYPYTVPQVLLSKEICEATGMDKVCLLYTSFQGDNPWVELDGNQPAFTDQEKGDTQSFEDYTPLDALGRCGVAYANLSTELLPTQERGEIGQVKPAGWHTVRYDWVDG